ncbi:MAG: hypothetical protein RL375_3632, partial [Pseudomonadota bacterium]
MLAPAAGAAEESQHSVKEGEPVTGTLIRRSIVDGSVLPINKTYSELSTNELAILRGYYEQMAPGDEPPFPLAGLKPIYEALSDGKDKFRSRGDLLLAAEVDATGEVSGVKVYKSPDPDITKFAASVLLLTRFKPAVCNGKACKMDFPISVVFRDRLH